MKTKLTIATRKSPLALWQANEVKRLLAQYHPQLSVELLPLSTQGDQWSQSSLAQMGGKGLFVKELEHALLSGEADLAVHSMKDMPALLPPGLALQAFLPRGDPQDVLVSHKIDELHQLQPGMCVGTTSLRRQTQLKMICPKLNFIPLRGNINTRLSKLSEGEFDAIILAAAGIKRLGFDHMPHIVLSPEVMLPACGQGIIGIECRDDDRDMHHYLKPLHHAVTAKVLASERAINQRLNGGCQAPVGAYSLSEGQSIWLRAFVSSLDAKQVIRGELRGSIDQAWDLGIRLAEDLLRRGAGHILQEMSTS